MVVVVNTSDLHHIVSGVALFACIVEILLIALLSYFPGRDLAAATSILGNGWLGKMALASETGLQPFLCSGLSQDCLQFTEKGDNVR